MTKGVQPPNFLNNWTQTRGLVTFALALQCQCIISDKSCLLILIITCMHVALN